MKQPAIPFHQEVAEDIQSKSARLVAACDDAFAPLLARRGTQENAATGRQVRAGIATGTPPALDAWPNGRRSRTKARIVLRRLAADHGLDNVTVGRRLLDGGRTVPPALAAVAAPCLDVFVQKSRLPVASPPAVVCWNDIGSLPSVAVSAFHKIDRRSDNDLRTSARTDLPPLRQSGEQPSRSGGDRGR